MIPTLSLKELETLRENRFVNILDVRESDEYQEGHIPEAVNLPLSSLEETMERLDKTQTYYVICKAGVRSEKACEMLLDQGIEVVNLIEGMSAYQGEIQ